MTSRFTYLLVLVLCHTAVLAQTATLRGLVLDAESGEGLPGANLVVTSDELRTGTVTQDTGTYSLSGLPAGTYTLTLSYIGYETQILDEIRLSAGQIRTVDFELVSGGILTNPVTVTASRRPEKVLESPASVTVLEARDIESRNALTAADHLKALPGVDLATTGLNQSRVVVRGFNDIFSGSLLTLIDNRIARVPSVRLNLLQLIPIGNADIEQMELVSGPASALYGPNSANGVLNIITKSPIGSEGTTVSVGAGERSLFQGAIRHAGSYRDKFGYKFSLQYYSGEDFEFIDPEEAAARQAALEAGSDPETLRIGRRNFAINNLAFDTRIDYRATPDLTLILNAGLTRGDNIELAPTSAAQIVGARVGYVQTRLLYKELFVQAYLNHVNTGDESYILRTGTSFEDHSRMMVFEAQHRSHIGTRQHFTYGTDLILTRPQTVTLGRNNDQDNINEIGAYLQSVTNLTDHIDLLAALRADRHNVLDALNLSPRAALVLKPTPRHTLRLTYNRAFSTPTAAQLFVDQIGFPDLFGLGGLRSVYGFAPSTDLIAQGVGGSGFHFNRDTHGRVRFRSPFAPLDPRGLLPSDYIDLDDPAFVNVMWRVARDILPEGLPSTLAEQGILPPDLVDPLADALAALLPTEVQNVGTTLQILNLETEQFRPIDEVADIDPLTITRTETFEIGYKGLIGRRLAVGIDLYHTRVKNFIGPFYVSTPNVFLDAADLRDFLVPYLESAAADPALAEHTEVLTALDNLALLGNRNGSGAEELANLISFGLAANVPFGTVTPEEAFDPTGVLLVQRNFGDISLNGLDAHFTLFLNRAWRIGGTYSYVSKNFFENVGNIDDIALNAPQHKAGAMIHYQDASSPFGGQLRVRFVDGFPVKSDVFVGEVAPYTVFDFTFNYRLPFSSRTRLTLSVQNLTDNKHREFVGVPEIGRLTTLRLTQVF